MSEAGPEACLKTAFAGQSRPSAMLCPIITYPFDITL